MPTPIKRAYRTFRSLFEREPWVFEVIFGYATAVFFGLLWADWQQGPAFGSMRVLSEVRSEDFWQWAGILGGVAQGSLAMFGCDARPFIKWPRWATSGILAWIWGAMAMGSWVAVPWNPTCVLYIACFLANIYVALHVLWEDEYQRLRRFEV